MKFSAISDRGLVREINEDYYGIISDCPGIEAAFIIADGMGGHNSGEVASRIAVESVTKALQNNPAEFADSGQIPDRLEMLVVEANREVYIKSMDNSGDHGMGTTMTLAVISGDMIYIAHVGDSRLYLIRNSEIKRITTDHSYIEELVKKGSLTREEAERHPQKNIITRALGLPGDIEVDRYDLKIEDEDSFVICTDGLTNMLTEEEIIRIAAGSDPEEACSRMVEAANGNGGEDNITVIVIRI